MICRALTSSDLPRLKEIAAAQGVDYEFPDIRMLASAIAVEDDGKIVQAVLARPTVELYFIADGAWKNPRWRMEALTKVHEMMRRDLNAKGFEDAHAWIPPQKKNFVRRLMRSFGWRLSAWSSLSRPTAPIR